MATNNIISSLHLEKLLEVNSKAIELQTVVHSQYEDIKENLEELKKQHEKMLNEVKENQKKLIEADKNIMKLNIILGSSGVAAIVGLIVLVIRLFILGSP
ncbi:MAG TPA: hypothetical protein VMX17_06780 [Candidatus Glassbacteria bacterium]|nr:hypothetical protein [Candidatus Glassbacteria bacterium]